MEHLRQSANVSLAAKSVGLSRARAYAIRSEDEDFAAAWDEAVDEAVDTLEHEARRRAMDGVTKPVFYKGEECGTIQEYSDTLAIFLLKAHRPERYREHYNISATDQAGNPSPLVIMVPGGDSK